MMAYTIYSVLKSHERGPNITHSGENRIGMEPEEDNIDSLLNLTLQVFKFAGLFGRKSHTAVQRINRRVVVQYILYTGAGIFIIYDVYQSLRRALAGAIIPLMYRYCTSFVSLVYTLDFVAKSKMISYAIPKIVNDMKKLDGLLQRENIFIKYRYIRWLALVIVAAEVSYFAGVTMYRVNSGIKMRFSLFQNALSTIIRCVLDLEYICFFLAPSVMLDRISITYSSRPGYIRLLTAFHLRADSIIRTANRVMSLQLLTIFANYYLFALAGGEKIFTDGPRAFDIFKLSIFFCRMTLYIGTAQYLKRNVRVFFLLRLLV